MNEPNLCINCHWMYMLHDKVLLFYVDQQSKMTNLTQDPIWENYSFSETIEPFDSKHMAVMFLGLCSAQCYVITIT